MPFDVQLLLNNVQMSVSSYLTVNTLHLQYIRRSNQWLSSLFIISHMKHVKKQGLGKTNSTFALK
jgi:hypothetical protein